MIPLTQRHAGVLVPLFALRGTTDFGCGDVAALRGFIDWAAAHGFRLVQLLPVNETGGDSSPYNAISSVAIEPSTIDPHAIADLSAAEIQSIAAKNSIESLREGPVKWTAVKQLRSELLRRAFENFVAKSWAANDARASAFVAFAKAESAWIEGYALFRVLMARHHTEAWDTWPEDVRSFPEADRWLQALRPGHRAAFDHELRFMCYVQWQAFDQWRAVKRYAEERGVALMGDIPFGVNYSSADVWAEPQLFDLKWSGGAPPEPAFADDEFVRRWGQNWGVPLYAWSAHRADGFAWWRQRVRKVEEAFHMFRIDHVLGFYRIYGFPWRPLRNAEFAPLSIDEARALAGGETPRFHEHADDTPEHRGMNRAQGEEFLRVLQDEVGPGALVGEDLGTVPEYVRPSLLSLEIPGFKVPQWEQEDDGSLIPGVNYPRCTIATYATHDHDPLRVMWERWMSVIRAALAEPERLHAENERAWGELRALARWAGFAVPCMMDFSEVHERFIEGLFRCDSSVAIAMITDVLGTADRFNVPGSVSADNWSARLPRGWDSTYEQKAKGVAALIRASGR
jgi:4-alpha-glucanotransferase